MRVVAYQHRPAEGTPADLVYDTDDVESFETPVDVHDVTRPGDEGYRRELGQAHLLLHFRPGRRPLWCDVATGQVLTSDTNYTIGDRS